MTDDEHHRKLERRYAAAPISRWYGATIAIADGSSEVRIAARPEFHHAAHAVHGSVYFRALDDAAFFAANSRVRDVHAERDPARSSHRLRLRPAPSPRRRPRASPGPEPRVSSSVTCPASS